MRIFFSNFGNPGVRLDSETRRSFLHLLGVEDKIVYLWENPLRGNPIQALYLMTECRPIPIHIQSVLDQESLIETMDVGEQLVEERLPISVKDDSIDDESRITHSFLKGNKGKRECDLDDFSEIQLPEIPDSDVGTELEMVIPPSLSNEEILTIFKRENCSEDGKCRGIHFFIGIGKVIGEKGKEYAGYHIFPGESIIESFLAFRSLLNKAMLERLKH